MKKICQKSVDFIERGAREYLGRAIAAPLLLAVVVIQQQVIPPASVARDVAICTAGLLIVTVVTWGYACYLNRELRNIP